jgi:ankyrin repeat protein
VNKLHAHGGSALMEACTSGNYSVVELLIAKGADPGITDKDGVTALMSAASQGHQVRRGGDDDDDDDEEEEEEESHNGGC